MLSLPFRPSHKCHLKHLPLQSAQTNTDLPASAAKKIQRLDNGGIFRNLINSRIIPTVISDQKIRIFFPSWDFAKHVT